MNLLLPATLLLVVSQLISRILGLIRDHIFANIFGATGGVGIWNIDTYYTAFRLPDLVYSLLIFGVLSAAFVPLLAKEPDHEVQNSFASNVLNVLLVLTIVLSGILFLIAEPITGLLAPGFTKAEVVQAAGLLRIQLLAPIFFTVSAVFGGLAQHSHRFTWYAFAPVLYNLGIIGGAIFLAPELGVYGLSWGVAIGAGLHALIQLPGVLKGGWRWKPIFEFRKLAGLFRLAGPRIVAIGANQLQFIVITIFATSIGTGALAVFSYAFNLASLPLGMVGIAFATVSFAGLARLTDRPKEFAEKLTDNLQGILFWVIPAATGLFILRYEITGLVLAGGAFTDTDTDFVATSMAALSIAVPFISILPLLNNSFFARKNTSTPLFAGLIFLVTTFFGVKLFVPTLEATGLAMAYSTAAVLGVSWLFWQAQKNQPLPVFGLVWRSLIATVALAAVVGGIGSFWEATGFWLLLVKISSLALLGGGVYFSTIKLLGLNLRKLLFH